MNKKLVRGMRVSPAMLVAMLALFVALTGTAVATTSALITGAQIKNNSITGADVKNKSLTRKDIKGQPRGPRGLRGLKGDKGEKGDKGDPGVPNPNADKLDGYDANSLTRVARGAGVVFPDATVPLPNSTCDSFVDIASVNITAPSAGFVQVSSDVTARRFATGGSGTVGARLSASSGEASALIFGSAGTSAGQALLVPLSPTWLFPVAAAGAFTVTLQGCAYVDGADAFDGKITAVFSPFGPTGTTALGSSALSKVGSPVDPALSE